MSNNQAHHLQTPERKQAAIEARRRLAAQNPTSAPKLFVVRLIGAQPFGWEIRKFGNFVLSRSETGFGTHLLARTAGEKALETMSPTES